MNNLTNRRTMAALTIAAITARLLAAGSMDGAPLMNSGWIAVLAGGALCLPIVLLMALIQRSDPAAAPSALLRGALGPWALKALNLVLCACSIYESALSLRILTLSAEFSAFDQLPIPILVSLAALVAFVSCLGGGMGLGGAVQLWRPLVLCVMALFFLMQLSHLNLRWLMPILGPGVDQLSSSALSFAGMQTAIVTGWLCMSAETGRSQTGGADYPQTGPWYMLRTLGFIALISAGMLVMICALSPPMPGAPLERDFYLEKFLANGKNATALQFPLTLEWFLHLMIMLGFYMHTAAVMLNAVLARLSYRWCLLICAGAGLGASLTGLAARTEIDRANAVRYIVVMVLILMFGIGHIAHRRRARNAKG